MSRIKLGSILGRLVLAGGVATLMHQHAGAAELIINGGFEADGTFTYAPSAWTVNEVGAIGAIAADNALSGTSHASGNATAAAASGSYFGSIDGFSLGAWSLAQTFNTSAVSSATLSFRIFVNDQSSDGAPQVGSTLDWESPAALHYARVDILKGNAGAFDAGSSIVESLYVGGATGRRFDPQFNPFVTYSFDVSETLAAGGDYTLRFAVINNMPSSLQLGVDDVSLQVTAVPEPEAYALMLAGLGLVAAAARKRSRRSQ